MDDEEKDDKKDDDAPVPDGILDDVLGEETDDEEIAEDPLAAIDEFGGGDTYSEKQWE